MANKVGPLIKEARTGAGLTQEQLAKKIKGVTASDISRPSAASWSSRRRYLKRSQSTRALRKAH